MKPWAPLVAVSLVAAITSCTGSGPASVAPPGSASWPAPQGSSTAAGTAGPSSAPSATSSRKPRPKLEVRYETESKYAHIFVVDRGDYRYLRFDKADARVNQSAVSLVDPTAVPTEYIRYTAMALVYPAKLERVLMVGLGGGTFTTLLRRHFPELWIDVAEIDPAIVHAATTFFGVQEDDRFKIHVGDGAKFVAATAHRYDLVLLDAYGPGGIPEHLGSAAFFESVKRKTAPRGVVVLNLSVRSQTEQGLEQRFRATFPQVSCVRTAWQGLLLFGRVQSGGGPAAAGTLERRVRRLSEQVFQPSFDLLELAVNVGDQCPRTVDPDE